jgi:hypothetical protein
MLIISRIFLLIFVFNILQTNLYADQINCNSYKKKNQNYELSLVNIEINDYKKWQVNNLRILTNNTHFIPSKFKKKFLSKVKFLYNNSSSCTFNAKIRVHGDLKDHILYKDGKVFQSLDVHLIDGHINNITKFKLFLEGTRGNYKEEIFMTELLRKLGYLSPRTKKVSVKLNNENLNMLFQEKTTKEFLEFNKRREGPILEADEKYMMRFASKIQNNPNINWPKVFEQFKLGQKIQLSKQTNSNWSVKNYYFLKNSFDAVNKLNFVYLNHLKLMSDLKNNYSILNITLSNELLAQKSEIYEKKLNIYNILILAANGQHALYANNRKFYWNSFDQYFEPIYYDGNFKINQKPEKTNLLFDENFKNSFEDLSILIDNLDKEEFFKSIIQNNPSFNKDEIVEYFSNLENNINYLKKIYDNEKSKYSPNINYKYNELTEIFFDNLENQKIDIKLVSLIPQKKKEKLNFMVCNLNLEDCQKNINFSKENLKQLLESKLKINNHNYQFLQPEIPSQNLYKKILLNDEFFEKVSFFIDKESFYSFDKKKKVFEVFQGNEKSRAFFKDGKINDVTIRFHGINQQLDNIILNQYDYNTLTGCLSFININFSKTNLETQNSNCEDGINILVSNGVLNTLNVNDSSFDGVDIDFSDLDIKKVNVTNALNDCIDLSGGNYNVKDLNLSNCGDKGVSVGEQSTIKAKNINIQNVDIGIASKDTSYTEINKANITNAKKCLTAYKKKQEFNGAHILVKDLSCKNFKTKTHADQFSSIEIINEL